MPVLLVGIGVVVARDSVPTDVSGNGNDRSAWDMGIGGTASRVGILYVVACGDQLLVTLALDYELAFD